MLRTLRVRDLAIIEELEVVLEPGLNVITGETGAGKSILLQALDVALGGRPDADLVRTGTGTFAKRRSEEHTSELQSRLHLVCRLLLEKKKYKRRYCNLISTQS